MTEGSVTSLSNKSNPHHLTSREAVRRMLTKSNGALVIAQPNYIGGTVRYRTDCEFSHPYNPHVPYRAIDLKVIETPRGEASIVSEQSIAILSRRCVFKETTMKPERPLKSVVGNWKMHTTAIEAARLAEAVAPGVGNDEAVSVTLCPPFLYLARVSEALKGSGVALGGQNLYPQKDGAFTGEVSAAMLLDVGCTQVILGHSERRHVLGESDTFVNQKVRFALEAGLGVILCVGETLDQRKSNQTEILLNRQLTAALEGISDSAMNHLSIAYEPVWAIGNAKHHATPQQAQDAHAIIRRRFAELYGPSLARTIAIQYGGSVTPENAFDFLCRSGVDGALVGGASLDADHFLAIIRAAEAATHTETATASPVAV